MGEASTIEPEYSDPTLSGWTRVIALDDSSLNVIPTPFRNAFYDRLKNDEPCGRDTTIAGTSSNMYDALNDAIKQLNDFEIASQPGRDKIIIISSRTNSVNQDTICDDISPELRPTDSGIDVIMINIPDSRSLPGDTTPSPFDGYTSIESVLLASGLTNLLLPTQYLLCLTNNDDSRIITSITRDEDLRDDAKFQDAIDVLRDEICSDPSLLIQV